MRKPGKAIGIDFGGTSVKIGLVSESGRVLGENSFPTAEAVSRAAWLDLVEQVINGFGVHKNSLAGIGVGVPGFTDFRKGNIYNLTNVPGWTAVPLANIMRKRFRLPVYVDNDVNAMALGEYRHGAGKRMKNLFFATLGTGVGGALIIDGKIYRGAYSMAGEIGHVSINMKGPKTPEGKGGLEAYVGNRRLVSYAARLLRREKKSLVRSLAGGDDKKISPKIIAAAAAAGDKFALKIMDHMADCLATAFAAVTYLLQPEAIIVGGGMAASGRVLFEPLRRHLGERLHKHFAERIRIIPAALGNKAGMIGCAALAFENEKYNT